MKRYTRILGEISLCFEAGPTAAAYNDPTPFRFSKGDGLFREGGLICEGDLAVWRGLHGEDGWSWPVTRYGPAQMEIAAGWNSQLSDIANRYRRELLEGYLQETAAKLVACYEGRRKLKAQALLLMWAGALQRKKRFAREYHIRALAEHAMRDADEIKAAAGAAVLADIARAKLLVNAAHMIWWMSDAGAEWKEQAIVTDGQRSSFGMMEGAACT